MKKSGWGFDVRDMDTKVRPQDDFYHYANGGWLKRNPIPPHESRWGSFLMLRYDTEKKLRTLVTKLQKTKNLKSGSPEQMVRDFYISSLDMKTRNALGVKPLAPLLAWIQKIKDVDSLVETIAHLEKIGGGGPWGLMVDQDMRNSEKYAAYIHQSGLGMPDRDYYLKSDAESLRVRVAYENHLEAIGVLQGFAKSEAKKHRKIIMRIETSIAKVSMTKEDLRDVDKTYHKVSVSALSRHTHTINWKSYFKIVGAPTLREVVVMQPKFLQAMNTLLVKEPLEDWKIYLTYHLVGASARHLSAKLEKQSFAFYGIALSGVKVMKPLWRRALSTVNGALGEVLGKLYVAEYFSPEAKKKITTIVDDLFVAYEARIKNLDWMGTATKRKALKKLSRMVRKLGYPDKWRSYNGLLITPDDYFGNLTRVALFEHARVMRRLQKPVDRKEWFMSPQTVNAYCNQGMNEIVFPAAILQPPFFDPHGDDAINYGGIGMVIGHEMTHNFDDQGSKFDSQGNRKTWWTKKDYIEFERKSKMLVTQFNKYKVSDGIAVNGQLTLGENIADLGGTSIAYGAYLLRLARTSRKDISGLTPEQRFFLGFALFERENVRPEFEKMMTISDPHSPPASRINGTVSNLSEFYKAFGVKKGDKLYRAPKDRARIW